MTVRCARGSPFVRRCQGLHLASTETQSRSNAIAPMTRPSTITFFGNFGTGNLGNECTLRAIVQNTRKHLPTAVVNCVCTGPKETTETHGIPAFLISYRFGKAFRSPR